MTYSWDESPPDYYLKTLAGNLSKEPAAIHYDIGVIGGLLKVCPKGVSSHLLLEIEQKNFGGAQLYLYRHRTPELTRKYKGKMVEKAWVAGFLKANVDAAKKLSEYHRNNPPTERLHDFNYTKAGCSGLGSRAECNACGKPLAFCICGR